MDERAYARYMADAAYFITRLEQNPNSKYFMPIALAYNKMEKYNESISVCKTALARFPSYCPVKTLLAEAYIYKGDPVAAKSLLFDVITDDPENYKALKLLGTIYKSSDETGEALKYFKAAYIRAPEDEDLQRMIEDLGASVSPDDLFAEYVKKKEGANWGQQDDKAYKDIQTHIRSAEVIMADLVSNTNINDNEADSSSFGSSNLISDDEFNKLLAGADAKNEDDNSEQTEQAATEYQETVAESAEYQETAPQNMNTIIQESSNIDEIENIAETSEDYSDLTNILEAKPQEEILSNDFNQENEERASNDSVTDVLEALDFTADDTPKSDDVLAALDMASEAASENEERISVQENSSSDSENSEVSGVSGVNEDSEDSELFVLEEPQQYESNLNEKSGEALPAEPAATTNEQAETNGNQNESDLFVLDEDLLENGAIPSADLFNKAETKTETVTVTVNEDQGELTIQTLENDEPVEYKMEENQSFSFLDDEHAADIATLDGEEGVNKDSPRLGEEILFAPFTEDAFESSRLEAIKKREDADDSILSKVESLTNNDEDVTNIQTALNAISNELIDNERLEDTQGRDNAYDLMLPDENVFSDVDERLAKKHGAGPVEEKTADGDSAEILEFPLENMISDDNEPPVSYQDEPATSLGESAPFSQRDILDEIYAASNINYGETDNETKKGNDGVDRYIDKEKTKARLLKLQAKIEKLKKG